MAERARRRRGTRRDGEAGGTRREAGSAPNGEGASSPFIRLVLPPGLAARFRIACEFPTQGAESDVVRAEDGAGLQFVVKLYRPGFAPDPDALDRLAEADPAHVIGMVDRGWEEGCWFEVLELCDHGSLRTLMDDGQRPAVVDVVTEVAAALEHVHGLGLVHRDLKPENLLIRRVSPLDLVLGDFGLVRSVDTSVRWTRAWGTPGYSPPEYDAGEVSTAWDWWSLGMIVAELAAGRHPFESPDGSMLSEQQMRGWLAQRSVDLSAVGDPRIAMLCRGLLTRDRRHRWGAPQVKEWLEGGSPALSADPDLPAPSGGRVRHVLFEGVEYGSPAELAEAFQRHWGESLRRLLQDRDDELVGELERLLRHEHLDEALRLLSPSKARAGLPRRFADLLAEMNPQLDPLYNTLRVTPAGLEAAAVDVIRAGGGHRAAKVLDEVRRHNILTLWRELPGMADGPMIQKAWNDQDGQLEDLLSVLEPHGYKPRAKELAIARAWLLLCTVNSEGHLPHLADTVGGLDSTLARQQAWWQDLLLHKPQPKPAALVAALLSHPTATQQTVAGLEHERRERERLEAMEMTRRRQAERDRLESEIRSYRGQTASDGSGTGWAVLRSLGLTWLLGTILGVVAMAVIFVVMSGRGPGDYNYSRPLVFACSYVFVFICLVSGPLLAARRRRKIRKLEIRLLDLDAAQGTAGRW